MNKCLLSLVFAIFLIVSLPTSIMAAQPIDIILNGEHLQFDVPPVLENGRVLVPLRAIFEALGATVEWDGVTKSVMAIRGNEAVKLAIGKKTAYKNGVSVEIDVPAKVVKGRILVPVRFVSETFGSSVHWDAEKNNVTITHLKSLLANSASNIKNFIKWVDAIYKGEPNPEAANKWIAERNRQVEGSCKAIQNHYQFFIKEWGTQIHNDTLLQAVNNNYQQAIKYMGYHTVANAIIYDNPAAPEELQKIAQSFQLWSK
ncbi:copper amine oxidase N-terminal domain-containing protein [Thermosediminibacter oceani]|uniref:Copper amine oxidase domain protein n=1 Tax=Thermosediminibacter oceani (strain ATCC BAA-1034 / DSM 16646 / JW/IW-1228P) TaxID=555079 RepID=D9S163_THEOJ|nr:copper amine oxidase N-terminal domain-containing protein [Thermosediminibacter oceani]ADL08942.1 copper amine oxidase domain protein [Thermosediminibacter oceani DSM 16646]